MIVRVLLAVHTASLLGRLNRLLASRDVVTEVVPRDASLWAHAGRGSHDLLIISRQRLPDPPEELLRSLRELPDPAEVVVLTRRRDETERALLLAEGCAAVLDAGVPNDVLGDALDALMERRISRVPRRGRSASGPRPEPSLASCVSQSPAMQAFLHVARRVVSVDTTLLLTGETGVGKEWLARAIHAESPRGPGPFVAVNCGAIPESLLESELFGHEEGAFTGATRARRGMFELAHRGTLFLDEIGEMPRPLQVRLLRVLQTREVQRVGAETPILVDVRILTATNRELSDDVARGRFRQDLFFRLGVVTLELPPLRERAEDIPELVLRYVEHFRQQFPHQVEGVSDAALDALSRYAWPGNVRELINVVERAMLLTEGPRIELGDLPLGLAGVRAPTGAAASAADPALPLPANWLDQPLLELRASLVAQLEQAYLTAQLKATGGRVGEAARRTGIDPRSLYDKMQRLGLRKEQFRR